MNKFLKIFSAAAAGIISAAAMSVTVCAEDYEFDLSTAVQSNGSWGQSFIYYTANDLQEEHSGNFDPRWLTEDSEVIMEYTYEGEANNSPVELIWQTWEGPVPQNPDIKGTWNKIAPDEYDETSAEFSFDSIVDAYGTDDFEAVYAICVGDTGVKLTLTSMTITNCEIPSSAAAAGEDEEEDAETDVEETSVKETEAAATTAATTNIADNAPKENGGSVAAVIVVVVIAAAAAAVGVITVIKKSKGKYY